LNYYLSSAQQNNYFGIYKLALVQMMSAIDSKGTCISSVNQFKIVAE